MSCSPVIATMFAIVLFFPHSPGSHAITIKFVNICQYPVWVAVVANPNTGTSFQPSATGFPLQAGQSQVMDLSPEWQGRIWGRTLCSINDVGQFSCVTGDCGSSTSVECVCQNELCYVNNSSATVAEFILTDTQGLNSYRVSLDLGYNLPMKVEPLNTPNCAAAGCTADLNAACPEELKVIRNGGVVACQSGCQALGSPEYCCSDCEPNLYSKFFKTICPDAYIGAYNNATYTCPSTNFLITFQQADYFTSSTEPGKPTSLIKLIGKVGIWIIVSLLVGGGGGVAVYIKCKFSNRKCKARIQMTRSI